MRRWRCGPGGSPPAALEEAAAERAADRLLALGYQDIVVAANGMVVEISGRIASPEDKARIIDALEAENGVSSVVDNLILVAPLVNLRPALLKAHKDEDAFTLAGEAPNPEARDLLAAQARRDLGARRFVNLMKAQDRRASEVWLASAEAALRALGGMSQGDATVERGAVALSGDAPTVARRAEIETELKSAIDPRVALELTISAPPPLLSPYVFEARKREGRIAFFACAAPDGDAQSEIVEALREAGGEAAAECALAKGAPNAAWADAVARGLDALAAAEEGEAAHRRRSRGAHRLRVRGRGHRLGGGGGAARLAAGVSRRRRYPRDPGRWRARSR